MAGDRSGLTAAYVLTLLAATTMAVASLLAAIWLVRRRPLWAALTVLGAVTAVLLVAGTVRPEARATQ